MGSVPFAMAQAVAVCAGLIPWQPPIFFRKGCLNPIAGIGIDAGAHFFETVVRPEGLVWVASGFLITVVPLLLLAPVAMRWCKMNFGTTCGMLCGKSFWGGEPVQKAHVESFLASCRGLDAQRYFVFATSGFADDCKALEYEKLSLVSLDDMLSRFP